MTEIKVLKRNGETVEYDGNRIILAITKSMSETKPKLSDEDKDIIENIENDIYDTISENEDVEYSVEAIQDLVENKLMEYNEFDTAKRFILYRNERTKIRQGTLPEKYKFLSNEFLSKYKHKDDPFPTELGKFIYYRTYSRPIPEENRRERWWETVARVVDFNTNLEFMAMNKQGLVVNEIEVGRLKKEAEEIYDKIYNLKLFPSGRSLWVGGTKASYEYPLSNFNCSMVTIDSFKKFSELFFVLMLGTGVGLSVERKYISKLPKINTDIDIIHKDYTAIPKGQRIEYTELRVRTPSVLELVIGDSKFAWSKAMELYLNIISTKQYQDIEFILINYDNVRPAGEILKTFGGRASGYTAIKTMFDKINNIFQNKKQKNQTKWQLIKPVDCLDMATIIAENVISGGVRRSALIVFCDKDEKDVLEAKSNLYYQDDNGNWISNTNILHRSLSNNTVFYYEKPPKDEFLKHFNTMKISGEPAIANMEEMLRRRPDAQGGNPLTI